MKELWIKVYTLMTILVARHFKTFSNRERAAVIWVGLDFMLACAHRMGIPLGIPAFSISGVLRAFVSWFETFGTAIDPPTHYRKVRLINTHAHPGYARRVRICDNRLLAKTIQWHMQWLSPIVEGKKDDVDELRKKFTVHRANSYGDIEDLYIGIYQQLDPGNPWDGFKKGFDIVWMSFTIVQIGAGIQEYIKSDNPGLLLWTIIGIILSVICSGVEHWQREELYTSRLDEKNQEKEVAIATEDRPRYALLILGVKGGWDLERMARGRIKASSRYKSWIKSVTSVLLLCWIGFVYSFYHVEDSKTKWVVASLGMLQGIYLLIGHFGHRLPEIMGMPLEFKGVIGGMDWMEALKDLELQYPGAGRSLLDAYIAAGMAEPRGKEIELWEKLKECERDDVEIRAPKILELERWVDRNGVFGKSWKEFMNLGAVLGS